MAIQTSCDGCGQSLQVADAHAGRLARCPSCNMIYRVPVPEGVTPAAPKPKPKQEEAPAAYPTHPGPLAMENLDPDPGTSATSQPSSSPTTTPWWDDNLSTRAAATPAPSYYRPHENIPSSTIPSSTPQFDTMWRMRTPEGQVYGPVPRNELDQWVREGRVSGDCQLRENDGNWFHADRMYTHLASSPSQPSPAIAASTSAHNTAIVGRESRRLAPDRGATILALGIMGWIVICPFISLAAWIMGGHDLREMSQGRMVRTNIGMTQVGRVLGMLHVLLAGVFLFFLFFVSSM